MTPGLELLCTRLRSVIDNVVTMDQLDSTHAFTVRLIDQMDEEGLTLRPTVVVAGTQEGGQGRGGRRWESPSGGLYLSWVRCGLVADQVQALPMIAAVAVHRAIAALVMDDVAIKWPNDVLVGGRKIAGILIHARHSDATWTSVGMGVNITSCPQILDAEALPATCLADHLVIDEPLSLTADVATDVVAALTAGVDDHEQVLSEWRRALIHRPGDHLRVRLAGGEVVEGTFTGLTEAGFLELDTATGPRTISGGDVIEQG